MRVLLLVTLVASLACFSVSATFTSEHVKQLNSLISSEQDKSGLWSDAKTTYDALSVYDTLKTQLTSTQQSTLKSKLTDQLTAAVKASDYATIHYIAQSFNLAAQSISVSNQLKTVLQKGLNSVELTDLYHSSQAIFSLSARQSVSVHDFDFSSVVATVIELLEDDGTYRSNTKTEEGTVYNAGLALQILGSIFRNLPEHEDNHRSSIRQATDKIKALFEVAITENGIEFATGSEVSNIEATSAVLKGISYLSQALSEKVDVSEENIEMIAKFYNENLYVTSIAEANALVSGLTVIANNNVYVPLFVTVTSSSPLKVRVTNILDQFATTATVTLASAAKVQDGETVGRAMFRDVALTAGEKAEYTLNNDKWNSAEPGFYQLTFNIEPKKGFSSAERYQSQTGVIVHTKITTTITNGKIDLFVSDSAKGSDSDSVQSVSYPKQLSTKLVADSTKHLHGKITFQNKFQPTQVFVQLTKDGKSAIFVAKATDSGYTMKVNLGSTEFIDSVSGSGDYAVNVIVGDALLAKSFSWNVATIAVTIPDSSKKSTDAFTARPEIQHMFRAPDSRPNAFFALIFTGVVVSPFAFLLLTLLRNFPALQLPTNPSEFLYAVVFQGSIAAILVIYIIYWIGLNIFQAFSLIAIVATVAIFSGNGALKLLHKRKAGAAGGKAHAE